MRIGYGFDVHAFGEKGPLTIGGLHIPFEQGLIAHSDGDVVLHALIDALLGAMGMGDIGKLFPDTDPTFKGADSCMLLHETWCFIKNKGHFIGNIDITIVAQKPKLITFIPKMRYKLSQNLNCRTQDINIKATTTEKLGFIGRGEGIACMVIALLRIIAHK